MNAGLSTKNAPSPNIVLPHYAFGAIAFVIASVMIFFASDNLAAGFVGPKILALTHTLVLSWISVIIFGALYQLIPVVMEVKLYSEKLAVLSFVSITLGSTLMIISFWNNYIANNLYIMIGGSLVIFSIILFVINALGSSIKSNVRTIENTFIISSVIWLLITVVFGFFIILNASGNYIQKTNIELLKIHFVFGVLGWFMMLVIGVASILMPMFFISHKLKKIYLKTAFLLTNTGIITLTISLYIAPKTIFIIVPSLMIFAGFVLFIKYNYDAYKKRLRRKLDIGMKLSVLAFVIFMLSLISGIATIFAPDYYSNLSSNFNVLTGVLIITGFLTALILGQMYKTLPFIVWLQKYQDKVGKFKIPLPNDLYSEKIADTHYYTYLIALISLFTGVILSISLIIKVASLFFVITALLYSYNTFKIILHKEKTEPLNTNK
jgi:hypothetical protein